MKLGIYFCLPFYLFGATDVLRIDPVSVKFLKLMYCITPDLDSGCGRGLCVVFKALYSHSSSLRPSVQMGADEFHAGG